MHRIVSILALNIRHEAVSAHIAVTGVGRKSRTERNSSKAIRILTNQRTKFAYKKPLVGDEKLILKKLISDDSKQVKPVDYIICSIKA